MGNRERLQRIRGIQCILLFSFCLIIFPLSHVLGAVRGEHLHVELIPESGTIRGTFQFTIRNDSAADKGKQEFFLYPEMFTSRFLRDNFSDVIDGGEIRPGKVNLSGVTRLDGSEVPLRQEEGPFVALMLNPPVGPGKEVTLRMSYEIVVPNHFSCFSSVTGNMYLNGAMFPLPADKVDGRRVLSLEGGIIEVETSYPGGGKKMLLVPNRFGYRVGSESDGRMHILADLQEAGLFFADYETVRFDSGGVKTTLFLENISRRQRKKIEETVHSLVQFLKSRHPELIEKLDGLLIIEAPLRKRVSFFTSYGVVVSDRIFESIQFFQSLHEESLLESVFGHLASIGKNGSDIDTKISAEFVGNILTDEFREFTELKLRNLRKTVKPVTFIPTFGRIYYDKDLPFARSYIRTVYQFGFPGEDFPNPEYRRVTGDSIYRVVSSYSPDLDPGVILEEYLGDRELLEILSRWGLDKDFLSVRNSDPRSDYWVKSVEVKDGLHGITLVNMKKNAPREVVSVLVEFEDGTKRNLWWDTKDREVTLFVQTLPQIGVKNVTIDPNFVMEDIDRANNYLKRPMRVTLHSTRLSYEFNTGDISASALLNFRRAYDNRHSYFLNFQTGESTSSVRLDYRRALRVRAVGGLFFQGGIQFTNQKNVIPSEENILEGIISLDYSSPEFPFYPAGDIRGFIAFSAAFYGRNASREFYTVISRVVKYFPIDLRNTLATKIDTGVVLGDFFRDRLLDLGGRDHIRGIRSGAVRVENLLVGTVELRHLITNDFNVDLPWGVFSLHGLSVNIFLDGGTGENPSLPPGETEGFRSSLGVGFFFFGNFLGIAPVNLNFQVARELDRFLDNNTFFYFNLNQVF